MSELVISTGEPCSNGICFFLSGSLKQGALLLLLLHGVGGDHRHFDSVVPALVGAGHAVLTVDLPGHGQSQADNDKLLSLGIVAECLEAALPSLEDALSAGAQPNPLRLVVGGLSMGGMLAQVCARRKMTWSKLGFDIVAAIAVACPSVDMAWPRIAWMDAYRGVAASMEPSALQATRAAVVASAIHECARKETARAMELVSDRTLSQFLRSCAEAVPPPPPASVPPHPTRPRFGACPLDLPLLLVTGAQDEHTVHVMSAWHQLNMQHKIDSRLHVLADAGHMVPLDAGARLAKIIAKFLSHCT